MKTLFPFLLLLAVQFHCYAQTEQQKQNVKYFNNNHRVIADEKNAVSRETKTILSKGYAIEKYNMERKQIESYISYSDYSQKEGLCRFYTDGIIESEGLYHIDLPAGKWKIFESGKLKRTIDYTKALHYFLPYYAETLQEKHEGLGLITAQNAIHKQEQNGNLKGLKFVSGPYTSFKHWLSDEIYLNPDIVSRLIQTSSKTGVSFTVNKTGKVTNPVIDRTTPKELSLEIVRAILQSPEWIPATENGKPISMDYTLIINFQYVDE